MEHSVNETAYLFIKFQKSIWFLLKLAENFIDSTGK